MILVEGNHVFDKLNISFFMSNVNSSLPGRTANQGCNSLGGPSACKP
nr:MAG TPA: hypothetical protein [Caudoviricetes sp.]